MDLDEGRKRIDDIDDRILALLEERAGVVADLAATKAKAGIAFLDPDRERAVLDRLAESARAHFPPDAIRAVYREVITACQAALAMRSASGRFST